MCEREKERESERVRERERESERGREVKEKGGEEEEESEGEKERSGRRETIRGVRDQLMKELKGKKEREEREEGGEEGEEERKADKKSKKEKKEKEKEKEKDKRKKRQIDVFKPKKKATPPSPPSFSVSSPSSVRKHIPPEMLEILKEAGELGGRGKGRGGNAEDEEVSLEGSVDELVKSADKESDGDATSQQSHEPLSERSSEEIGNEAMKAHADARKASVADSKWRMSVATQPKAMSQELGVGQYRSRVDRSEVRSSFIGSRELKLSDQSHSSGPSGPSPSPSPPSPSPSLSPSSSPSGETLE